MTRKYLKKAKKMMSKSSSEVTDIVQGILNTIENNGEAAAREYALRFDKYAGNLILTSDEIFRS